MTIELHTWNTPNGRKISVALEEMGLPYKVIPVNITKGEQMAPSFLAISPNNKIPAIVDPAGPEGKPLSIFESGAILLYLAEKTGKFLPKDSPAVRGEMLSWLMFVATGIGPYSGQAVHFKHHAPEKLPYAVNRYLHEAERHWGIIDARLAKRRYMLGDSYTIVDMAVWGWARAVPFVLGDDAWEKLPNLKRLFDEISARPAAQRANALKDKHAFKTEMDEEARRNMFPQNVKRAV